MKGFTAGAAVTRISEAVGRPVDVVIVNTGHPSEESLARYAEEHKEPLPVGDVLDGCEVITGEFWQDGFARHGRRRLAYAVWGRVVAVVAPVKLDDGYHEACRPRCPFP